MGGARAAEVNRPRKRAAQRETKADRRRHWASRALRDLAPASETGTDDALMG